MAAGLLTIGFGIPINAFSLGNTLIISGTVAVVGGLVLIGLGAAIRQLNRISVALNSRPMARPAARARLQPRLKRRRRAASLCRHAGAANRPHSPSPGPRSAARHRRRPRPAVEPRFPAAAEPSSSPLDWLRSKPKPGPKRRRLRPNRR